jgi:cystathionine gamma-lyase
MSGDSTRTTHAGLPPAAQGAPFLPGPSFAAPVHWSGEAGPDGYGRTGNATWSNYEAALSDLEGGEAIVFSSGMAAVAAVLLPVLHPGDVLVVPGDAYPGVRTMAVDHLEARGVEVRAVPSTDAAYAEAAEGATLVWAETPSNPGMDLLDIAALATTVHAAGGLLAIDGTVAGPLRQRPLDLGADFSMISASKHLTGHSDLVMGYVATRDPARGAAIRAHRGLMGAIPGPFEVWLAHRSLPTLAVRLERQEANAAALVAALEAHPAATDVRWPGVGSVLVFTLADGAAAERFLTATQLVADATSFGGVHSSAERRGRWGTDAVPDGFVRFSAGIEDAEDLVADVRVGLDAARG